MAAIGGITFWSVQGEPDLPGEELETIQRPAVDGVAYRKTGRRASSFQLRVKVDLLDGTAVYLSHVSQKALQGSMVSFTNDLGNTYNNYVVERVQVLNPIRITNGVGGLQVDGAAQYWLESVWTLRYPYGA